MNYRIAELSSWTGSLVRFQFQMVILIQFKNKLRIEGYKLTIV